jgi:hypothetical protein
MKNATSTTLSRDAYGSLYESQSTSESDRAIFSAALDLVKIASAAKKIPVDYDAMSWGKSGKEKGKKIGDALHHEIYDISADGRCVLVCARSVSGDRYGQKTTGKEYFLIRAFRAGVKVEIANKALSAKAAKSTSTLLGAAIAIVSGKATYHAPANKVRSGFKLVSRDDSGALVSVWDKSIWALGKTRTEAATEDHRGGFYYYSSIDKAISAAATNETFGDAIKHHRLVVIEVEASGRHFRHDNEKLCASRIRPVREVAMTL